MNTFTNTVYLPSVGNTIYIASVIISTQPEHGEGAEATNKVMPVDGVYTYSASLYYKQCTPKEKENAVDVQTYAKDVDTGKYLAANENVTLLTTWDLSTVGTDTVVLPCINKNSYFESLITLSPAGYILDALVSENEVGFGQSLDLRTFGEVGTLTTALEVRGFFEGKHTARSLEQILIADKDTGVISVIKDTGNKYKLLVRIEGEKLGEGEVDTDGRSRPRIGYMPIGFNPDSGEPDPDDDVVEKCDQNTHPMETDPEQGAAHDDEEPHPDEVDGPSGGNDGDQGDADHPAAEDCYTTK